MERRTTLLLLRLRFHLITRRGDKEFPLLAEDCQVVAFAGSPQNPEWLEGDRAEELLQAQADANIEPDLARDFLQRVIDNFDALRPHLDAVAIQRGDELLDAHRRVQYRVEPQLPPAVLGLYVYLPKGSP